MDFLSLVALLFATVLAVVVPAYAATKAGEAVNDALKASGWARAAVVAELTVGALIIAVFLASYLYGLVYFGGFIAQP